MREERLFVLRLDLLRSPRDGRIRVAGVARSSQEETDDAGAAR